MAVLNYDKVLQVDIGRTGGDCVTIRNIVFFAEEVVSPDGDLVDPLSMINSFNPAGIHQNHKYWKLTLRLDTNWYPDDANKHQYWEYHQNVDAGDSLPAIVEDGANPDIEYMVVHLREHDGTWEKLTYANVDTNILWCVGKTSVINNETGERHAGTVTFQFICLQERVRANEVAAPSPTAGQGAGVIKRIANVREGGEDAVNILSYAEDFVMKMTPKFIPNYYQGLGLKQDEKFRVITVVVDSETDIFDNMLAITAAQGVAVTDFEADFVMDDTAGTVETWAYTPVASVYMMNRKEGRIDSATGRKTIEYVFICYGSKGVSQA